MSHLLNRNIFFFSFRLGLTFLFLSFLFNGCFGKVDTVGSVKAYQNGIVFTEGGRFRVGVLSPDWVRKKINYKAVLFLNQKTSSSMSINSFCKGSADDAPLPILTNQLFYGMTDQKDLFQGLVTLNGREALRTRRSGKLDGVSIVLDTVVLKMNTCVFDFIHVASLQNESSERREFENLFGGFQYISGSPLH